jgi:hypothetical protein
MTNGEGDDDDEPPTIRAPAIKNPANRELVMNVANLVLEAQQHSAGLRALYVTLCGMETPAPSSWGYNLIEEYERHRSETARNIAGLRASIR